MDDAEETVRRLVKPIFDKELEKVPKETGLNTMGIGKKGVSILWRPNNYRRKLKVALKTNTGEEAIWDTVLSSSIKLPQEINPSTFNCQCRISKNNHTKVLFVKNFGRCTMIYGKTTLTAVWSQNVIGGVKETFLLKAKNVNSLGKLILERRDAILRELDIALYCFSDQFGIRLKGEVPKWCRYEDWFKGEEYVDSLPKEVIVHDDTFKKVYGEGLEFKSGFHGADPGIMLRNYVKNRALEDVSPLIARELALTRSMLCSVMDMNDSTSRVINEFVNGVVQPKDKKKGLQKRLYEYEY